jgi:tetratricopeptide (TPR) repeat protein
MRFSATKAYPIARSIFVLLVLFSALCAGLHTVADYDMGWHLATGRYVVQHRQIPRTDVLSFTSAGDPWAYPPFAGVLLYLTYCAFGYAGLSWFCALACLTVVAYLVRPDLARRGDLGSTVLAMLAVQSIAARTAPRADLFSTVFFALFLGELWAYHRGTCSRPWLLPVVMLLWVNLHPGFIAGLGVIGAYLLTEVADLLFAERRQAVLLRLRKVCPWLAACGVATLVNPWGPKVYVSSLSLSGLGTPTEGRLNGNSFIGELQGIPISRSLFYQLIDLRHMENGLAWLLLVAAVLAVLFLWKRQFGAAVIVLAALYSTLAHARYMGMFVITIATIGGPFLSELFVSSSSSTAGTEKTTRPSVRVPAPMALLVTLAFCGVALLHIADFVSSRTYVVFNADWRFGAGESSWFPERAATFIRREQLPRNIFEEYALGGYVAWSLGPQYPDFVDGRGVNPDVITEQRKLYSEGPDSPLWQSEADRWNLNVLLVATSGFRGQTKMDPLAFCQSANWRPVYMDDVSLVFLRNTPQNRPWIERLQIDCRTQKLTPPSAASRPVLYDFYLNTGALFLELQRDQESEQSLRRASALYPEDPNVHLLLAALYQNRQRYREAEQEYRASIALTENNGALYYLGVLYAAEGRNVEAVEAIERAAKESTEPLDMYMTLGKLQIALHHPQQALAAFAQAERHSPFRNGGESVAPELYAQIAEGNSEAHRLLGHWPEAIAFQQEATRRTPLVVARWIRLADLYEATGQTQLAAEARQRAAELQGMNTPR